MTRPEQWNDICPLCKFGFDTPTYNDVFKHNKDVHEMSSCDNDLVSEAISMQDCTGKDVSEVVDL